MSTKHWNMKYGKFGFNFLYECGCQLRRWCTISGDTYTNFECLKWQWLALCESNYRNLRWWKRTYILNSTGEWNNNTRLKRVYMKMKGF